MSLVQAVDVIIMAFATQICRGEHCSPVNLFQKILPRVTLLFFFTEKKKKKQKKKSSRLPFFCTAMYYTDGSVTAIRLHITKLPRRGYRQLVCRDTVLF